MDSNPYPWVKYPLDVPANLNIISPRISIKGIKAAVPVSVFCQILGGGKYFFFFGGGGSFPQGILSSPTSNFYSGSIQH